MPIIPNTLSEDATNEIEIANLYHLRDLLQVMQQNLNSLLASEQGNQTIVSFGNLFEIASKAYGDATLWTAIADSNYSIMKDENGFITPNISDITTLKIPPKPTTASGGILIV